MANLLDCYSTAHICSFRLSSPELLRIAPPTFQRALKNSSVLAAFRPILPACYWYKVHVHRCLKKKPTVKMSEFEVKKRCINWEGPAGGGGGAYSFCRSIIVFFSFCLFLLLQIHFKRAQNSVIFFVIKGREEEEARSGWGHGQLGSDRVPRKSKISKPLCFQLVVGLLTPADLSASGDSCKSL